MFEDDSRGLESPDRSDVPTCRLRTDGGTDPDPVHDRLAAIDRITRELLVALYRADEHDGITEENRAKAARHVHQIRAEATHVGLALVGPEAAIAYDPFDDETNAADRGEGDE